MKIIFTVPKNFNFWHTVYSHGWCSLPPFEVDKEKDHLKRVLELSGGKKLIVAINQAVAESLNILTSIKLNTAEKHEVISQVSACLRLEEDYSEFYREASRYNNFHWVLRIGAGRLLRAPTVFEDVVKMICTTNCSWALTETMVGNLCTKLGVKIQDSLHTFPASEAIAGCSEKFLRKEIRAGYRAPFLLELSRRAAKGELNLESWRKSTLPTKELFEEVRSIKGIGPYAAGNILKLLGRYDYLGIDSWCRKKFFEIHRNGRIVKDKVIERHYEPFGKWKGLFFWMDVTRHWYDQKFPF
jgi:3-methyladenine DNA glycosylase/8-oxoguanine DNA glycosylase